MFWIRFILNCFSRLLIGNIVFGSYYFLCDFISHVKTKLTDQKEWNLGFNINKSDAVHHLSCKIAHTKVRSVIISETISWSNENNPALRWNVNSLFVFQAPNGNKTLCDWVQLGLVTCFTPSACWDRIQNSSTREAVHILCEPDEPAENMLSY